MEFSEINFGQSVNILSMSYQSLRLDSLQNIYKSSKLESTAIKPHDSANYQVNADGSGSEIQ